MNINLLDYQYNMKDVEPTDQNLLKEARSRGFDRDYDGGQREWRDYFSELFFSGGQLKFKEGFDAKTTESDIWRYTRQHMGGFMSSHEDKTAVCSMLMAEVLELPEKV